MFMSAREEDILTADILNLGAGRLDERVQKPCLHRMLPFLTCSSLMATCALNNEMEPK